MIRVAHLLRPAQGGMLQQVRSLLHDPETEALLAAPPRELAALSGHFPLPESDGLKAQLMGGWAAGRWARSVGAQVLHGHGLKRLPLYVLAARVSRLPLVVTLHNLAPKTPALALLKQAQAVIAVSEAVAKTAPVPCHVIYNGIATEKFSGLPTKADARARLGWPQEQKIILSVARLSKEKGLDVLCEAWPGAYIAGDGPERAALTGATLLGIRDDIPLLLAAADIYCQPSRSEGLGLAVLEAMAAGKPIVASAVGGIPELLPDASVGLTVPADDPAALRVGIQLLLDDPARAAAMGTYARQRVTERFTEAAMRTETRKVYARLLR
ncbi:glycosyltransferase family 4 protein [Armatimonas rosea]|uniref:Glycosyltransferase involved in cell wall biosynthesis n=1 Tax=Armatimonas rosea TaxID=685828 RepID=A0A7W9SLR6_ARMRO|nr:glycosyltransferase family 4 protein [Armatimonas rosea]MBB6048987.1 glycosyltransferase involved in cell wall biosynthesis [Armatimonas rosea]